MTQTVQTCECRQCSTPTATPKQGLCTICYENRLMLGRLEETRD